MKDRNVVIRKAKVGTVNKSDVLEAATMEEPIIFAFNVPVTDDIKTLIRDNDVKLFSSDIIYRIIEDYEEYTEQKKRTKEEELLKSITLPARFRILPGYVFRQSKPAVFGVEIMAGTIKPRVKVRKQGTDRIVGTVKELQLKGENVKEAKIGDRLAVSMDGVVVGRTVKEGDIPETAITKRDAKLIEKIKEKLRSDEVELFEEIKPNTSEFNL